MRKSIIAAAVAVMGVAGPALAKDALSYSYVELGYVSSEVDDLNTNGSGLGLRGSYAFTDKFHGFASYTDQDFNDFDVSVKQLEIGGGTHWSLTPKMDFVATLSYLDISADAAGGGSADDNGFGLGAQLRGLVTDTLELRGGLKYANFDESGSDTTAEIGARWDITKMFGLAADVDFNNDGTSWMLGCRFNFPK
jgi:hypothetical protein